MLLKRVKFQTDNTIAEIAMTPAHTQKSRLDQKGDRVPPILFLVPSQGEK